MKIKPIHKSWTIGNHIIHVDMSIKELLERVPLHLKEMKLRPDLVGNLGRITQKDIRLDNGGF
jgi:hypothetical protein